MKKLSQKEFVERLVQQADACARQSGVVDVEHPGVALALYRGWQSASRDSMARLAFMASVGRVPDDVDRICFLKKLKARCQLVTSLLINCPEVTVT